MPNHKQKLPVVFNHRAILRAFGNDPEVLRSVLKKEGYPAPTSLTAGQWYRSDRGYIAAGWLPLVMYVGLKTQRLALKDLFAAPSADAEKSSEINISSNSKSESEEGNSHVEGSAQ